MAPEKFDQHQDPGPDRPQSPGDAGHSGTGHSDTTDRFVFPKWVNGIRGGIAILTVGGILYLVVLITAVFSPKTSAMGYAPVQPVAYSHALHAGDLGIDCRYCHTAVEATAKATLPPTATCMNCHATIKTESAQLAIVRESAETGRPIPWVRVHDLPDFVYFNHAGHIQSGVGCVSCHGHVDRMAVVEQVAPLNMGWCLECHRDPEPDLRPEEFVTDMNWTPAGDPVVLGAALRAEHNINPSTDCTTCHR